MPIVYWKTRQIPLEAEEIDGNFAFIEERLRKLEENQKKNSPIASISIQGKELCIEGVDGTKFPSIEIPIFNWIPKGIWKKETFYQIYHIIQHHDCLYLCSQPHTSGECFEEEYWQVVFRNQFVFFHETLPANPMKGNIHITEEKITYFDGKNWVLFTERTK